MGKLTLRTLLLLLLPMSVILFTGCGDDDDDDGGEDDLIGTWTVTGADLEIMVGGQTLQEYLEDQGFSSIEASALANLLEEEFLGDDFTGTLTVNSDGTYSTDIGGESDSGEWTLNGDVLTITSEDPDEDIQMLTVTTLNSSTLVVEQTDTEGIDVDDDGSEETLAITLEISFSK